MSDRIWGWMMMYAMVLGVMLSLALTLWGVREAVLA